MIKNNLAEYIEPEDEEFQLDDDILVSYEYYYNNYFPTVYSPEKELAKGILIFAIIDYLSHNKDKGVYNDARKWFFRKENDNYVFSFSSICDLLEINEDRFRKRLKKRKKSKTKFILDGKRINT